MTPTPERSTLSPADDAAFLDASFRSDLIGGLLVASRACVKLVDVGGALIAMNTPGRALMEIDDFGVVCGKPWDSLWPEAERARIANSVAAALEGTTTNFTAFCPTAKGSPKWWDVTVSPVRDDTGAVVKVLSCSYDVTHIKEREAALQKLVEDRQQVIMSLAQQLDGETRRLSEARRRVSHAEKLHVVGQFVGNVVHDINNVLAVMQSASRVLRRRLPEGANSDIFDQVDKSVARGSTLVRRLLDFSRADGGLADVFSPSDALSGDADLLRHLVGDGIAFSTEASPNLWPVLVDKAKFQSVVFNLVSNARDAVGDEGAVTVSLRNCPSQQRPASIPPGDYVVVTVSDNGCGMPPEVLARAGEPFFTTKSEGRGTGLGLASAFELADQSSGRVLIDSAPGAGTRVSIYLPRAPEAGLADDARAVAATHSDHDKHGGATILVVKNDLAGRQHVANLLRRLGYVVLEASSEAVALATALREVRIDLVISDLAALPGGAARLADRLRQEMPTLPFIFIRSEDQADAVPGELTIVRPVTGAVLAGAVLTKLGRLPAVLLSPTTLSSSERILERVVSDAVRNFGAAWLAHCTATTRLPSPADLQPNLDRHADHAYVVAAVGGEDIAEFKFVRAGSAIVTAVGHTIADDFITSSDQNVLGYLSRAYKRSATGMPYRDTATASHGSKDEYERLIVPLSADGRAVTHLAGIAIPVRIRPESGHPSPG